MLNKKTHAVGLRLLMSVCLYLFLTSEPHGWEHMLVASMGGLLGPFTVWIWWDQSNKRD